MWLFDDHSSQGGACALSGLNRIGETDLDFAIRLRRLGGSLSQPKWRIQASQLRAPDFPSGETDSPSRTDRFRT